MPVTFLPTDRRWHQALARGQTWVPGWERLPEVPSLVLQLPNLVQKEPLGTLATSCQCRKPHPAPFLQSPCRWCLHTTIFSLPTWQKGHHTVTAPPQPCHHSPQQLLQSLLHQEPPAPLSSLTLDLPAEAFSGHRGALQHPLGAQGLAPQVLPRSGCSGGVQAMPSTHFEPNVPVHWL